MQGFPFDKQQECIKDELKRLHSFSKLKHPRYKVDVMVWIEMMYRIWIGRCKARMQGFMYSCIECVNLVIFRVGSRIDPQWCEFLLR